MLSRSVRMYLCDGRGATSFCAPLNGSSSAGPLPEASRPARLWRDAVNKRGGDVTVVHLPDVGLRGNTHFPFSDLNNVQVADLMSEWLRKKGLDR
jgi:hypothetical protein